jgi:hypothetical protein
MSGWQTSFHRIPLYIFKHNASFANDARQYQQPRIHGPERPEIFTVPIKLMRILSPTLQRKMLPKKEVTSTRSPSGRLHSTQSHKRPNATLPEAHSYMGRRLTSLVTRRIIAKHTSLPMKLHKEKSANLLTRMFGIINSKPHSRYPSGYCLTSNLQPQVAAHCKQSHIKPRISYQSRADSKVFSINERSAAIRK